MKILKFISVFLLLACSGAEALPVAVKSELYFTDAVRLKVEIASTSGKNQCFPIGQFDGAYDNIQLYLKDGNVAEKKVLFNKALQFVGGVDMAEGVYVVGKTPKRLYISLDNFSFNSDNIDHASINLRYFSCRDIDNPSIKLIYLNSISPKFSK